MGLVGFPHSGSQVTLPLFYLLQGEAGVSGLPGGIGLRGPPVSDYSLYLYCMYACGLRTTLNQRLPVPLSRPSPCPFSLPVHPLLTVPWHPNLPDLVGTGRSPGRELPMTHGGRQTDTGMASSRGR